MNKLEAQVEASKALVALVGEVANTTNRLKVAEGVLSVLGTDKWERTFVQYLRSTSRLVKNGERAAEFNKVHSAFLTARFA